MTNYLVSDTDLANVANAIRTKGGTTGQLEFPVGFVDAISAIETGSSSPFVKLYEETLSEQVSAVKVDITEGMAGYDFYFLNCIGRFTSADWWYWNANGTGKISGQYSAKVTTINSAMLVAKVNSTQYMWGGSNGSTSIEFPMSFKATNSYITDLQYLYIQGYQQKFATGTRITLWGANYADI